MALERVRSGRAARGATVAITGWARAGATAGAGAGAGAAGGGRHGLRALGLDVPHDVDGPVDDLRTDLDRRRGGRGRDWGTITAGAQGRARGPADGEQGRGGEGGGGGAHRRFLGLGSGVDVMVGPQRTRPWKVRAKLR